MPERHPNHFWDIGGAHQFCVLIQEGLRANHRVLDVGCGSLRLGRILIPWLDERRYFGIEPNEGWLTWGIDHLPAEVRLRLATDSLSTNLAAGYGQFGQQFDYVLLHSIWTHAPLKMVREQIAEAAKALTPKGKIVGTFLPVKAGGKGYQGDEWVYPKCVAHSVIDIQDAFESVGLRATPKYGPPYEHFYQQRWVVGEQK